MCGGQRHPERTLGRIARQHHDHTRGLCLFGQVFGMPGKGATRFVDDPFVQGRCHHRSELSLTTTANRPIQQMNHITRIGDIELTRHHRNRYRHIANRQRTTARCLCWLGGVV